MLDLDAQVSPGSVPSCEVACIDSVAFAAAIAPLLRRMQLLLAVRMGEMWPPQLARQLGHRGGGPRSRAPAALTP